MDRVNDVSHLKSRLKDSSERSAATSTITVSYPVPAVLFISLPWRFPPPIMLSKNDATSSLLLLEPLSDNQK